MQNYWGGVSFNIIIPPNIFCIEFVNIGSENASFFMLEDSIWLQLIYFSTTIAFWFVKYLFPNLLEHSKLKNLFCVVFMDKSVIMEIVLQYCIN